MLRIKRKFGWPALAAILLILAGCFWSGTFVINKTFTFAPGEDFYSYRVDLTTNATWLDHKDNIDRIETIGFVLYLNSSEPDDVAFSAYVNEAVGDEPDQSSVPTTAKVIIDSLPVAPGKQVISYPQSLKVIRNVDTLKKLAITGKFDFYGTSTGNDGVSFKVDSVTVIVTFTAS
jgi:hypothetical protein